MTRTLPDEDHFVRIGAFDPTRARRRQVLRETVARLEAPETRAAWRKLAQDNLSRWRDSADTRPKDLRIEVLAEDWGTVAGRLTRLYGQCFAVLNMANAFIPGGGYVEGAPAQEENMFRRTDCHFSVGSEDLEPGEQYYRADRMALLSGRRGRVYLDVQSPRICCRGPEDPHRDDLGYVWLEPEALFPFWELRASAQDVRAGTGFDTDEARRRIAAQLDTLIEHGVRHAVLSAFGCGAFGNPAETVSHLYRDEIQKRRSGFSVIAFAIFHPGYGPDNFTPFKTALG